MADDTYKVVKIKDGDTMEILSNDFENITVRLAGIDCPEKTQPYGKAAKQYLALLCFGKNVKLDGSKHDRYGRTVATVLLTDGRNINYEMVKNGLAWQYKQYSTDPKLALLEEYARENRLGLWQQDNPVEPWNFRKKKTKKKSRRKKRQYEEAVSLVNHY
ncbi:nuclease [Mucilaginibacter hurinus]|uniref:Nuclease n=2 Tax=Mucilaginibacter hurinus TaxID=2201324 RepID=A0A367GN35_9SPHI|nr:nuclease [Mucilaginibacter hurinus]